MLRLLRPLALVALLLVGAYAALSAAARPRPTPAVLARFPERPLVIAHRGGRALRPENTLVAFEHAAALGADLLELDVQLSVDGELMVIHDATVDRTTDGRGRVAELTRAELQRLDAGWSFVGPDGGRPWRESGVRIPVLAELFAALPEASWVIEIKPSDDAVRAAAAAPALCAELRASGLEDRVIVASFQAGALAAFGRACPGVAVAAGRGEVLATLLLATLRLDGPYVPAVAAFQIPPRQGAVPVLTRAFVRAAHAKNVPVHAWTLNEPEAMRAALELGVDGIITDRPDAAMAVLGVGPLPASVPR